MVANDRRSESDAEVEREILQGRKFTPREVMARMAGPGSLKGGSPVPRTQQAATEIGTWMRAHVTDPAGALQSVLHRQLVGSELLLDNLDHPLAALARHCERLLASDYLLKELVRQADSEWGRRADERPHFDREGASPDPGDPYTIHSVRDELRKALERLEPTFEGRRPNPDEQ
jgi:hypothetical protein